MRLIGLTGGIATGKSTVAGMLRALGAPVLDADVVAREVVAPGQPALEEIARRFPGVVDAEGKLDRAALGERVFSDAAARAALEAIVHPRVRQRLLERSAEHAAQGAPRLVLDVPLLFETGLDAAVHDVLVVWAPPHVQLGRLMARDGLGEAQARARLAAQLPVEEKRRRARWTVDNGGTVDATRTQVDAVWRDVLALPPV